MQAEGSLYCQETREDEDRQPNEKRAALDDISCVFTCSDVACKKRARGRRQGLRSPRLGVCARDTQNQKWACEAACLAPRRRRSARLLQHSAKLRDAAPGAACASLEPGVKYDGRRVKGGMRLQVVAQARK